MKEFLTYANSQVPIWPFIAVVECLAVAWTALAAACLVTDVEPLRKGAELPTKGIKGRRFPANAAPLWFTHACSKCAISAF
jgi:hypothetical protein